MHLATAQELPVDATALPPSTPFLLDSPSPDRNRLPQSWDDQLAQCRLRVYLQALRRRLQHEDAEDVAQEAVLRLIRWPRSAERPSQRWLSRLTSQCLAAHRVRMAAHDSLVEEPSWMPPPDPLVDADTFQCAEERLSLLEFQLIFFHYELGWTTGALSECLEMTPAAVRAASRRARIRFRTLLEESEGSCKNK